MSAYFKKLQNPRWQKVRLKVLERDGWRCLACESEDKSLQVHHLIYTAGEPWDAPIENLETLCRECHEWREDFNDHWGGRSLHPTLQCMAFNVIFKYHFIGKAPFIGGEKVKDFISKAYPAWVAMRLEKKRKKANKTAAGEA